MSEHADTHPLNCSDWSDLGVGDLPPTGTVTLLLADVEGSTRLWESRLFVSPRTVQTHLTHVYNKLGVASRVQLAQGPARRR